MSGLIFGVEVEGGGERKKELREKKNRRNARSLALFALALSLQSTAKPSDFAYRHLRSHSSSRTWNARKKRDGLSLMRRKRESKSFELFFEEEGKVVVES